jgi:hypothetical protein
LFFLFFFILREQTAPTEVAKPFLVVVGAVLVGAACVYFVWLRNGARIIRERAKQGDQQKAAIFGFAALVWTLVLPLLSVAVIALATSWLK